MLSTAILGPIEFEGELQHAFARNSFSECIDSCIGEVIGRGEISVKKKKKLHRSMCWEKLSTKIKIDVRNLFLIYDIIYAGLNLIYVSVN
jgi:hypothetical protein